ncbi:hypothetical protein E4U42_003114 [Claviceps africana]|uniref:DUF3752 domain-containing protein n=1 Tax=Claviceps africana TaxID=83212 RepID=A0A8K0J8H0_9HYPO|nr:hypothetical protein E4U42_003114 [Claviceps africana]
MWTETPQEKLQRQKDALLGRAPAAAATDSSTRAKRQQREQDDRIAASIEAARGTKSLYAEHDERRRRDKGPGGQGGDDDDDPSKRAFDREKDMAIGGKIGSRARAELISKSANFGGRFQKGSFL